MHGQLCMETTVNDCEPYIIFLALTLRQNLTVSNGPPFNYKYHKSASNILIIGVREASQLNPFPPLGTLICS